LEQIQHFIKRFTRIETKDMVQYRLRSVFATSTEDIGLYPRSCQSTTIKLLCVCFRL